MPLLFTWDHTICQEKVHSLHNNPFSKHFYLLQKISRRTEIATSVIFLRKFVLFSVVKFYFHMFLVATGPEKKHANTNILFFYSYVSLNFKTNFAFICI